MSFAKTLKKLREERHMLQKELSELIGVAPNTVSNYEQGSRLPKYKTIEKIADVFGVTTDYLIGITPKKENSLDDIEKEFPEGIRMLRRAAKLDPKQRKKLLQLMEVYLDSEE